MLQRQGEPPLYGIGDYVGVFIDKRDRTASDPHYLPCVIYDTRRYDDGPMLYKVRCKDGILSTSYHARDLKNFKGCEFPDLEHVIQSPVDKDTPVLSVRHATRLMHGSGPNGNSITCRCSTGCKNGRCPCRRVNNYCTLKCHSQSTRNCSNTNLPSTSNGGKSRRHRISKPEIARRPITRSLSTRQTRSARR